MQKKVAFPYLFLISFLFTLFCYQWMGRIVTDDQRHWSGPSAPQSKPRRPAKIRNRYSSAE